MGKTKEEVLQAGKDEEKEDEDGEEKDQKEGAKDASDPTAPLIEACIMGAGKDCTKDSSFEKVVSLPAAVFDKKEWNTIKVVLPVKKGERVAVRFNQKQTECECCNYWGIDALQMLTGDECYPASINEDAWQK